MESISTQECVVIGAGIVGVSTGIWLARAGKRVTIVDRAAPGEGTSHGNAGVLACCSMVPVTVPGLVRKVPSLLLDKNSPLFVRWAYLPKILPWLRQYLAFANDSDTRRIADKLNFIVSDSLEQHQELAGNTQADRWLVPSDYQFAYPSRAAYLADAFVWQVRERYGFVPEVLEGPAVQEKEPALGSNVGLLAVLKQHGHITSPGQYVKSLASVFESMGGTIRQTTVRDLSISNGKVESVLTDTGAIPCQVAVIATGVWSGPLCDRLALNIPMESERGYHIIFKDAANKINAPTMIAAGKFVATPMNDDLRCAGIVELGGLKAGPSKAPLALLQNQVAHCMPNLRYSDTVEWLGHRPAPVDSLPFIGQIGCTSVYTAFGHHHVGLTGGPKTGRLIAELITGERDAAELDAFRPDRFAR